MYYVYIIQCEDDTLYTGFSTDPKRRFLEHKTGKASKYTRAHAPKKLVYTEKFPIKNQALKREWEIKHMPRTKKLEVIKLATKKGPR
jgi:putative endonuclease